MISKAVHDYLAREAEKMTQAEMAALHRTGQSAISKLLHNPERAAGLSIDTLERMFPGVRINLGNGVIVGDRSTVEINSRNNHGGDYDLQMINQIMTSPELSAESKIAVWQILQKHNPNRTKP